MGKHGKRHEERWSSRTPTQMRRVSSLLKEMKDGNEYGSIVSLIPDQNLDMMGEIIQALSEIETIRGRPCLAYIANVITPNIECGIDASDDLPFTEMIAQVPPDKTEIDIFLVTGGGSAHQVSRFVNALRGRFGRVEFLLPSFCMSAGTLFALSGDRVWMTRHACMGPIDPQIPSKDGTRFVPAQALLLLVQKLEEDGTEAMRRGNPVPWTAVRIIDSMDKKELADALTASSYSTLMATEFLKNYKFKNWKTHNSNGTPVTPQEREDTAGDIAKALASHTRWKSHGHAISREVLWSEVRLLIDRPEDVPGLERALARFWALCYYVFDRSPTLKIIASQGYRFVRNRAKVSGDKD